MPVAAALALALHLRRAMTAALRETQAPPSRPTVVPTFELGQIARNAEVRAEGIGDLVYEAVLDVSWKDLGLDDVERRVLASLDGISPVEMVETALGLTRDELHSVLCVLRARGLIAPAESVPRSGLLVRF